MSTIRTMAALIVLSLIFVLSAGCIAVAAGAGVGTAYAVGQEKMYSDFDVEQTTTAVKQAFEDYEVNYNGTEKRDDGVMVHGNKFLDGDNEEVEIGIWNKGDGKQTKIEVRIGTFGKSDRSHELMNHIQKRLDAME